MNTNKVYVDVTAVFSKEGQLKPVSVIWQDGHIYEIQRITDIRRAASLKAGGVGMRYTCIIDGKETHLFPYNFFSIDYYDEVVPENLYVSVNDQKIRTSLNSYCYTSNVNKLSREACVDSDYKVSLKYSDKLNIKSNDNIELSIKFRKVNNIKVYKYSNEKDLYKKPKLDKNVSV